VLLSSSSVLYGIASNRIMQSSTPSSSSKPQLPDSLEGQVKFYKDQIAQEKAGKRKLFHSMVKLANELKKQRAFALEVEQQRQFVEKSWYEGGLWRAPTVLPAVGIADPTAGAGGGADGGQGGTDSGIGDPSHLFFLSRPTWAAISLSDLFFNLVVVTAFTRVGVAVSVLGYVDTNSLLYFAVFWGIWGKETSYTTRFDTSDLSARITTLVTCFAVLFASLSAQAPIDTSVEGTRIMIMAASVAILHLLLHVRVALTTFPKKKNGKTEIDNGEDDEDDSLVQDIRTYAFFNIAMNALETSVWVVGITVFRYDNEELNQYRWLIYLGGVLLALRVPRAFLANDFHGTFSL